LQTLLPETKLEVVGQDGQWLNVRLDRGASGWVNSKYTRELTTDTPQSGNSESIHISANGELNHIEDSTYFFSIDLPKEWTLKSSNDIYSSWRISAVAPNRDFFVDLFALKAHGDVDLERFAAYDSTLFGKFIGIVINTREIKKAYFWTTAIEKNYGRSSEGLVARSRFYSDGTYGYVVVAFSRTYDFARAEPIFSSFKSSPSLWVNEKNRLAGETESKSSSEIVKDLAIGIFLFAVPIGIGLLGHATRRRSWLLTSLFVVCGLAAVMLFVYDGGWWSLGIPCIMVAIIFAGRYGIVMWLEN
jgi:hypothetical protein